jgi:predicted nucleic acid-binding protein
MILLDTNVLIYASTDGSPFLEWARRTIASGVSEDGAAVNAVSLAELCRRAESGRDAPSLPLPDFFIGAHAQIMVWQLATADEGRFRTYFPSVTLRTP